MAVPPNWAPLYRGMQRLAAESADVPKRDREGILFMSQATDQFWSDDAEYSFEGIDCPGDAVEAVQDAISCYQGAILNYYSDSWNFAPGQRPVDGMTLKFKDIPDAKIKKLLKDTNPEYMKKLEKKWKADVKEMIERRREYMKELRNKRRRAARRKAKRAALK